MLSRPMLDRIAVFGISWYAILIVAAVIIGYFLAENESRRLGLPRDTVIDFLLYGIPLAILGARIYYVLFRFNHYSEDIFSIFDIREGGLAIYGGILGGILAAKLAAKNHHVSIFSLLDIAAPSLVLGQAIGRWGNYINMEAYGLRVSEEALQFFPFAVEIPVGSVWYWHMATFFYEFCWDIIVFILLLIIRHHTHSHCVSGRYAMHAEKAQNSCCGDVFAWYLLLYCAGRTVIEGLRFDSLTFISEFVRISQILSALAALGVVVYFFVKINDRISAVTIIPLVSAVMCLVTTFLGEFERGAYSTLFIFSQISLALIIISQLAIIALWAIDSGRLDLTVVLPLAVCGLFVLGLLIAGFGRANLDNTYYVSLRQCGAMLQLVLCGWLLYYPLCPNTNTSEE